MNSSAQHSFDWGRIQNSMGFLNPDHTGLYPNEFLKQTHLTPTDASKALDAPRANFYKSVIPLKPSSKLKSRVMDLVMVTDVAYSLFGKNAKETSTWLMSANILLFGASPFEVCMRGDGKALIEWLLDRAGVVPAAI